MKYKNYECQFDTSKVTNIWQLIHRHTAICDNKEMEVLIKRSKNERASRKKFVVENKIICILERVQDGLEYLNSYELRPNYSRRNAFDFIEFLNCEYVIIHCIKELAQIFGINVKEITEQKNCFAEFAYGDGCDNDVFEYVRSLCAVHPEETSFHPTVHLPSEFDSCARIVWDIGSYDGRDLTAVVYTSKYGKSEMYIGIEVVPFVEYLRKWVGLLDEIYEGIRQFAKEERERLKKVKILPPERFNKYTEYIDNLKNEYEHRDGEAQIYLFDYYKKVFQISFQNSDIENKKECYKNAIKYMFAVLHEYLQEMNEDEEATLFYELYQPIEGRSKFANDRGAFDYVNHLESRYSYEVYCAREVLDKIKPWVNEYVEFHNNESKDEIEVLLQIATYFDALKQDGYINANIPNEAKYRGELRFWR